MEMWPGLEAQLPSPIASHFCWYLHQLDPARGIQVTQGSRVSVLGLGAELRRAGQEPGLEDHREDKQHEEQVARNRQRASQGVGSM